MRHLHWLLLAVACCLACGTRDPAVESVRPSAVDDEDDDSDEDEDDDNDDDNDNEEDGDSDEDEPPTPDAGARRDTGASEEDRCSMTTVAADPKSPDVLIVLDRSGSMLTGRVERWAPSASAVKALTGALGGTVGFGLMLFPAPGSGGGPGENEQACTPGAIDVPIDVNAAEAIAAALDAATPDRGGQTPTAATLEVALQALAQDCADCPERPKYVLLVTDGQPNCGPGARTTQTRPEDITATTVAIDALAAAGIKTFVIGYDTASDPELAATLDEFASHGGTGQHFPVVDEASLITEFTNIVTGLVACEFVLSAGVEDPDSLSVIIDGEPFTRGADWELADGAVTLHPDGPACLRLRDGGAHKLQIIHDCPAED